jgi:hypothetical protein
VLCGAGTKNEVKILKKPLTKTIFIVGGSFKFVNFLCVVLRRCQYVDYIASNGRING